MRQVAFTKKKSVPVSYNKQPSWYTMLMSKSIDSSNSTEKNYAFIHIKVSCSTIVEVFAKHDNALIIPEGITKEDPSTSEMPCANKIK